MRRICFLLLFTWSVAGPSACRESTQPDSTVQPTQGTPRTLVTKLFQAAAESDEDAVKQLLSGKTLQQIEAVFARVNERGASIGWQTFMAGLARIPVPKCTKVTGTDGNDAYRCVGLTADVTINSISEGGKRRLILPVDPFLRSLTDAKN